MEQGGALGIEAGVSKGKEAGTMKQILIIDDDPSIRLLYQEELLEEGYDVISSDGENGVLQLIREQRPDLILLDLKLGRRSGLDLLQDIRKESWAIPVILLTAYPAFNLDSRSVSACAYVTKNSDLKGLKRQIEKCLNTAGPVSKRAIISDKRPPPEADNPSLQLKMRFQS